MRNLNRISNHYNKLEAHKDWEAEKIRAIEMGFENKAIELEPPPDSSWRLVDKRLIELREFLKNKTVIL